MPYQITSKILEENRFDSEKKYSTDLCVFTSKLTIQCYNLYKSSVYSCV